LPVRAFSIAFIWLVVCVLLVYAPDIGRGFVADDFGWIYFSRLDDVAGAWTLLVDGTPGFYRPLVALSFSISDALFGLAPAAYAVTNLALAFAIAGGIIWLAVCLGFPAIAGVFGAGLWILNFHGISMALMWISGRTSLLATLFAVYAAVALVRGRSILAGWLTFAALLSKEEPIMLPVTLALWLWIDRLPAAAIARAAWPSFAALAAYLAMRTRTDAITPANAPSFYRLSLSPDVLLANALSYLDRSLTFTAAVLLLGVILFVRVRPRLLDGEWQAIYKGAVWLVLGFAVTIMVPVRSSLYVVLPTVGAALIGIAAGSAIWRTVPAARRRAAVACLAALPILVLPIHWLRHQTSKSQAILSTHLLEQVRIMSEHNPSAGHLVVVDDPEARPSIASAFGAELPRAVELVTGRRLQVELLAGPIPGGSPATARGAGTIVVRRRNSVFGADGP
jgi:hypothetical protein